MKENQPEPEKRFASRRHNGERRALAVDENAERLRQDQAAAMIGTWEWDPEHEVHTLSPELFRIFGLDAGDPQQAEHWESRLHSDDRENVLRWMKEGYRAGSMEFEYRYLHPERGVRWLYCMGRRFRDEERMFGIVQDVTARKASEVASQRLSAIVTSSDDAIISKNLQGIVTSWNPAAQRIFGYTAQEMIGKPITTIIPEELLDDETRILATIARGERIEHFETVRVTKSGERIEVSLTVSPVRDERGQIVGAAKIARDITQRKRAERALRTSERLAAVGRLAATIAHEVNNPLEAVTNLVYLARSETHEDNVRQYLTLAEEELERISQLTKQTLGFYRDSKGSTTMHVGPLVQPLVTVFASRTRNKGVTLVPEIVEDPEIHAVPGEVRQLLANFISNSIDAVGASGRIRVRVSAARNRQGARGVRITIADTGPGIPAAHRAKLFEPFFTTKRDVGTGLGLWVCQSIVAKHHGSIRLRTSTAPGKSWTVFSIFLPSQVEAAGELEVLKQAV